MDIKTEEDYRSTLQEIESLMAAEPGTPKGKRLDVLVTLIEVHERKCFPLDSALLDKIAAELRDAPALSDEAVSRAGIYADHP